jgi:hypothetical protein
LLFVLGLGTALGAAVLAVDTGSALPALALAGVWLALAVLAWRRGRVALFFLILPVFWLPAGYVGAEFSEPPCGLRPPDPRVVSRDDEFRAVPPHYVCDLTMTDGRHEFDGGPPASFFIAFGWAALATGLALARRPGPVARAALIAGTWLLATFALFFF